MGIIITKPLYTHSSSSPPQIYRAVSIISLANLLRARIRGP
jgi:hypothetical protein